ncbi:MAG TPA: enoyl-CoA hydratase/isomerase family protein [Polyangiales bacterium]|nr:enoyl-CoA hydratase/isomerase family protein [Polyangiales bacterium]
MIELKLEDGIYELELKAPPLNEIGLSMLMALEKVLDRIDPAQGRALLIYSSLPGGFSAGADLRALYAGMVAIPDPAQRAPLIDNFIDRIHAVADRLDMLPITTVGAIHGVCFGGGFELALTCDVLVADKTARFAFPELRLGLVPGFGGIPRLKRDVGNAVVRDLLQTGRSMNAKRAQNIGLVSQMVAQGKHVQAARATAKQAARFDADANATCKAFIKPLPTAELAQEKEHFKRLAQRPAVQTALKKFVESTDLRPYL